MLVLGSAGAFAGPSDAPPIAIGLGATLPIATFLVAYATLPSFRRYVLSIDLRLLASIQAWRWAGLGFLTLYAYGVLAALFAWTAGLGDMASMAQMPLVLVPGFLVPFFVILHLTALFQAQQLRQAVKAWSRSASRA